LKRHADAPNPLASFVFWNRTRREVALIPMSLLRRMVCFCPYLDYDMFDFLMGLSSETVIDKHFHEDVIHTAYPEYAHVPYTDKRRRRPMPHYVRLAHNLTRYAAQKQPQWWRSHRRRILGEWVPWLTLPTYYRRRNRWLYPPELLYAVQLMTFCQTRSAADTLFEVQR